MSWLRKKKDDKQILEDKALRDKIKKDLDSIENKKPVEDSVTDERKVFVNSLNLAFSPYAGLYNPDDFIKMASGFIEAEKFNRLMALFGEVNISNKLLNILINEVRGLRADIKKLNNDEDSQSDRI